MLALERIRDLDLAHDYQLSHTHLSAASGLVVIGDTVYVIADDELHLGIFSLSGNTPGKIIALFSGKLPLEKTARKKLKPDLETLTVLPTHNDWPDGALLALGSGSKDNRQKAIIIPLDKNRQVATDTIIPLDLEPLYSFLRKQFSDLNIEGAFIAHKELILMQRGNQTQPECALIYCQLDDFLALLKPDAPDFSQKTRIVRYTLPKVNGVPLCFTDGALLPDGNIIFTAVAEDTTDSYNDGECVGAAIGIIDNTGHLASCHLLETPYKIEGITTIEINGIQNALVVTDADNASIPATLYSLKNQLTGLI